MVVSLLPLKVDDALLAGGAVDRTNILLCKHGIILNRHLALLHEEVIQVLDLIHSNRRSYKVLLSTPANKINLRSSRHSGTSSSVAPFLQTSP